MAVNGVWLTTTIPPTGTVDVKTYGAKGDSVTDITRRSKNTINAQNDRFIKGAYIINQTVNVRSGVKIYSVNRAAIKPINIRENCLLTGGIFFL